MERVKKRETLKKTTQQIDNRSPWFNFSAVVADFDKQFFFFLYLIGLLSVTTSTGKHEKSKKRFIMLMKIAKG